MRVPNTNLSISKSCSLKSDPGSTWNHKTCCNQAAPAANWNPSMKLAKSAANLKSIILELCPRPNAFKPRQLLPWPSSGPEICVVWPWKMPASGWGSFWESSSSVPWLIFNAFRVGYGSLKFSLTSLWLALSGTWFYLSGLLCRGGGRLAALAPK